MDSKYLIDRAILEKFVDPLITQKYPNSKGQDLSQLREDSIKKLDDSINDAIFDGLAVEQLKEINKLLNDGNDDQDAICKFLDDNDINLEVRISEAVKKFKAEFMGGEHA